MEKIIRFKRNWEESYIRVNVCEGSVVEIDTPLAMFEKRFLELVEVPNITFKTTKSAEPLIREAVIKAFRDTVSEMKEETKRV